MVTLPDGPVQAFDVELSDPQGLPPVDGGRARVLVRRHGAPVAFCLVDVPAEGLEPAAVAERLADLVGPAADAGVADVARHDPAADAGVADGAHRDPRAGCRTEPISIRAQGSRTWAVAIRPGAART